MCHQVAGVLPVIGGIYHRNRLTVQLPVDIDKGEKAGVGQSLGGLIAANSFDIGFNADEAAVGIDHPSGVMQSVTHAHRIKEVDSVNRRCDRTVWCYLL